MSEAGDVLKLIGEADFDADDMSLLKSRQEAISSPPKAYSAIQRQLTALADDSLIDDGYFNVAQYAIQVADLANKYGKDSQHSRVYIEDVVYAAELAQRRQQIRNPYSEVQILHALHNELSRWKALKVVGSDFIYRSQNG